MDRHKKFMEHRTTEVMHILYVNIHNDKILQNDNILALLVHYFIQTVRDDYIYTTSFQTIETMRTVFCSYYQDKIKPQASLYSELEESIIPEDFRGLNVDFIQDTMYTQFSSEPSPHQQKRAAVLDILVIYMFLFHDETQIWTRLEGIQNLMRQHLIEENEIELASIKLMDCYMDSILLQRRLNEPTDKLKGIEVSELFMKNMQLWLTLENCEKTLSLIQVLPKLFELVGQGELLPKIWQMIFNLKDVPFNVLSHLSSNLDVWFPMESDYSKELTYRIMEEPFWLLLLQELSTNIYKRHSTALRITKRVVEIADKPTIQNIELSKYQEIRPLVCIGNDSQQDSFNKDLTNFFNVLESLESSESLNREPEQLIAELFPLLETLLNNTSDQENHKAGLHIAWKRCACSRILQHRDNAIVKWGLLNMLTLDPELYNDELLSVVLGVLNHPYLYEHDVNEEEPTVVKELTRLLNNAETKNSDLVARMVLKASKMTWTPMALFYVIHALSMVEKVGSRWNKAELDTVKSLADIISTMDCQIVRIGSQIKLLDLVPHFATESLDLVQIANTLSAFSTSDALIRGQLAWKRVCAWLSNMANRDQVLTFFEKICGQMTNEESQTDLSETSFALIIMLLHDAQLLLNSTLCPGLTTLRDLVRSVEVDCRSFADSKLRNRSIKLISHLMGFMSTTDSILCELIFDYADATLRFTFTKLRKVCDEALVDDINTYVSVTEQFFRTRSSTIAKSKILNHIERFEVESWNIIEDGKESNNMQRFFGIKILYACLKAMNTKLINYKFIGSLSKAYKIPMTQSSGDAKELNQTLGKSESLKNKIEAEYYKYVAELFHEYVKNESVDEWIPDIDWIQEVSYLIQVGSQDILEPLVRILSQIFYKEAVRTTDIVNFKTVVRLCWLSMIKSAKCFLAIEEMTSLLFSPPFLECEETRELTIQCTHEILEKGNEVPELRLILLQGLKQLKGEYLSHFYEAVLFCLLHGSILSCDQKIELQACSYVINCYNAVYPNHLSNMNVNHNAATRAHAVTLLHKMINDDPTHAAKLLPLILAKLDESQNKLDSADSEGQCIKIRIMQVLLVLQPVLEKDDMETLYLSMCDKIISEKNQRSVRVMQEWLLVRIYLKSETRRAKIWDLFDQGRKKHLASLLSVTSIVYHVARMISSDLQLDFINQAFQYIISCCMTQQSDVRLYAQVIASKLYILAREMEYSTITEKYREFYIAVTNSLEHENPNSIKLEDDFSMTDLNIIGDYSLQTLFYELPRLSNVTSDEYVPLQMFEKFGFKESNSHPLKLLTQTSDTNETQDSQDALKSSGNGVQAPDDIHREVDCSNNLEQISVLRKTMGSNAAELEEASETLLSCQKTPTKENNIILVASVMDNLPDLSSLSKTCKILEVEEFVVSSMKQADVEKFQSYCDSAKQLVPLVEVKPQQLQQYLLEKRNMGYRLIGAEQTVREEIVIDHRAMLFLGNDKQSIAPNLAPLLERFLTIPQVGVLPHDVDVIEGIFLLEYFKQYYSP